MWAFSGGMSGVVSKSSDFRRSSDSYFRRSKTPGHPVFFSSIVGSVGTFTRFHIERRELQRLHKII